MTFGRKTSASRPLTGIVFASLVGLTGCAQVYDDTKGWGNDVEAWFRQEFIQELKNSIHSIGKEPSGVPATGEASEPALVQQPEAPAGSETPAMAAKAAAAPSGKDEPKEMQKPAASASKAAPGNEVASNAATLPNIPTQATATTQPQATQGSAQQNLYPQTAGQPPAGSAGSKTAALPARKPTQIQASALSIHLSSNKSKEAAQREWNQLKAAFPDQLNGLKLRIARTDLGKKGVFYRVLAGSFTDKPAAKRICSQLRKKQQYCAVMPAPTSRTQATAVPPKAQS